MHIPPVILWLLAIEGAIHLSNVLMKHAIVPELGHVGDWVIDVRKAWVKFKWIRRAFMK